MNKNEESTNATPNEEEQKSNIEAVIIEEKETKPKNDKKTEPKLETKAVVIEEKEYKSKNDKESEPKSETKAVGIDENEDKPKNEKESVRKIQTVRPRRRSRERSRERRRRRDNSRDSSRKRRREYNRAPRRRDDYRDRDDYWHGNSTRENSKNEWDRGNRRKRHRDGRILSPRDGQGEGRTLQRLPMSNYLAVAGFQNRLVQLKLDTEKNGHPYPIDTHLLQHPNPRKIDELFDIKLRLLDHLTAPTKKYYSRKKRGEMITVNHWGQRKLLMSEIEFLTRCVEPIGDFTVIYAGAAPGSHTNYLADMFPNCHFVLVDPAPFVAWETDKVSIIQDYMTEEIAERYKDTPNVLFVSDIRTANPRVMSPAEVEERVKVDNQLQIDWIEKMDPEASLLKFRCPYYDPKEHEKFKQNLKEGEEDTYLNYKYYKGDIYLPVWGRQSTTETRLYVPKRREMMNYEIKRYEGQCFYFNTETRVMYYPHDIKVPGLDHCFDCRSEVKIVEDYLRKFHWKPKSTQTEAGKVEEKRTMTEGKEEATRPEKDTLKEDENREMQIKMDTEVVAVTEKKNEKDDQKVQTQMKMETDLNNKKEVPKRDSSNAPVQNETKTKLPGVSNIQENDITICREKAVNGDEDKEKATDEKNYAIPRLMEGEKRHIEDMIYEISENIQIGRSKRTLEFVEPTVSSHISQNDFKYEKNYSLKLVGNAPDQRRRKRRQNRR